jgi:hypothetical protein
MVVDLTDNLSVNTVIPKENHAALRAGFSGYPANPRWNTSKYRAWKIGALWRESLAQGKMTIRDSMLVPTVEEKAEVSTGSPSNQKKTSSLSLKFPFWSKGKNTFYQTV